MNTAIYILIGLAVVFAIAALISFTIDKYFDRKEKYAMKQLDVFGNVLSSIANDLGKRFKKDD